MVLRTYVGSRSAIGMARACAAAVVLGGCFVSASAMAAPQTPPAASSDGSSEDNVNKALARYRRGQELYTERNFPAALIEFRKAYEVAPNYRVLYNIGQVCYQMQDYVCALRSLEQYLKEGSSELADTRKQEVGQEITALKARIGYLDVHASADGAELSVDDVPAGTLPLAAPLPVSAGRHRVTVTLAGHAPVTRTVDVAGQDTSKLEIALPTLRGPDAATSALPPAADENKHSMTTLSWLGYGLGAGLLAGAGVTGALALGPASDVRNKLYANDAAASSDRSKANNLALVSDVLLGAGVITVVVTTVFTFIVPHRSSRTASSGLPLRTHFTF